MQYDPPEFWLRSRSRLLSSRSFQKWAATSIFTRFVARKRARALFDLCAGFVYSQVLYSCVTLDLFKYLRACPRSAEDIAVLTGIPLNATLILLDAAASLGLLQRRRNGHYGLGAHGAALLANPGVMEMIRHHAMLYEDLSDPVALLRGDAVETHVSQFWKYARNDPKNDLKTDEVTAYTRLMSASQDLISEEVLDCYSLARHRLVLDAGGGDGTFACAALARYPTLSAMVFDLPPVADKASARFRDRGFAGRAKAVGGNFLRDELPSGADLITLIRVIHDHDDESVLRLLQVTRKALLPSGRLLIAEPLARSAGAEVVGDAYFGFYFLAMGSGRARSFDQISALLVQSGFAGVRLLKSRQPIQTSVLIADC